MKLAFADTYYFLALLNPRDQDHDRVVEFSTTWDGGLLTSEYVLLEVADALSKPMYRPRLVQLMDELKLDETVEIIPANADWFEKGMSLYRARQD